MGIGDAFRNIAMVRELTPRLFFVYMFMSIGAVNFGFDNGWWSSAVAVQQFIDQFGKEVDGEKVLPSGWLSAGSGTGNAGMAIGCIIAGPICRKVGRKWTVIVIVVIALVGMVIQNAVPSYWGIMVGRMINAISMGLEANNIPVFMAELSPPAVRGSLVNFYQWWQIVGVLISHSIIYKTNLEFHNQWAWRMVMVIQMVIPVILLCIVWILPESPRWLLIKGRREDALKSLLYVRQGAATPEEVEQELVLLQEAINEQEHNHRVTSYWDCLKGSNGRRTMIGSGVQILEQLSGNAFMSSYSVIFLEQVGITNPLQSSMARTGMALAGATMAFILGDKLGRRPLMIFSAFWMWVILWITAGISAFTPGGVHGGSTSQGLLAGLLFWNLLSTGGWGSCVWMITAEVGTAQLREKTISISTTLSFVVVLLVSYINPFVQNEPGNLGARVGFVYGSFSLISIFFVYFFVPELSNRSLEELDELFESRVPAWKFKSHQCHGIGARITEVQNINADAHAHILAGSVPTVQSPEDGIKDSTKVQETLSD